MDSWEFLHWVALMGLESKEEQEAMDRAQKRTRVDNRRNPQSVHKAMGMR